MGWIYRDADAHHCRLPNLQLDQQATSGDRWKCDGCGRVYEVNEDQHDGRYFVEVIIRHQRDA